MDDPSTLRMLFLLIHSLIWRIFYNPSCLWAFRLYPSTWYEESFTIRHVCGRLDFIRPLSGHDYNFHIPEILCPLCGLWSISVYVELQIFILLGWSVHFVDFGLYPSMSDFKFSSSWDDPSTLWTLVYILPCRTSNFHPPGMIRPLCGLWFISVHVGFQIFILLRWFVHFVDYGLHPSISNFKFSSSWDDPSTLWTFVHIHPFWTCNFHPLGWSVHFVDPVFIPIHS